MRMRSRSCSSISATSRTSQRAGRRPSSRFRAASSEVGVGPTRRPSVACGGGSLPGSREGGYPGYLGQRLVLILEHESDGGFERPRAHRRHDNGGESTSHRPRSRVLRPLRLEDSMTSTAEPGAAGTIVLIHGLWMTPLSWEKWIEHY